MATLKTSQETQPTETLKDKSSKLELSLLRVSQVLAFFGGAVLLVLTVMTVYSIIGRSIVKTDWLSNVVLLSWWRPVRGDFELIEIGTALAIFSFLPYCQMARGNVLVDFFTSSAHPRVKSGMAILSNGLFFVLSSVMTWRMVVASEEFYSATFKQSSMILKIPAWQGMFVATSFMFFLSMVCLFSLYRSIRETLTTGELIRSAS